VVVPAPATAPSGGGRAGYRTAPFNLTSNVVLEIELGAVVVAANYTDYQIPPLPAMGGSVIAGGGIGAGDTCRYVTYMYILSPRLALFWPGTVPDRAITPWERCPASLCAIYYRPLGGPKREKSSGSGEN
jgi:hypothetical protein